jgi:hypothetical protein
MVWWWWCVCDCVWWCVIAGRVVIVCVICVVCDCVMLDSDRVC